MSEENLRLAAERYDAWNRGDLDAILADVPDDFEFRISAVMPDLPEVIRGPEGLRQLFEVWYSGPWKGNLRMDVDHLIDLDDERVLGLTTLRGTGEGSGVEVEQRYAHLITIRNGVNVRVEGFTSWERALAAAGLAEIPE